MYNHDLLITHFQPFHVACMSTIVLRCHMIGAAIVVVHTVCTVSQTPCALQLLKERQIQIAISSCRVLYCNIEEEMLGGGVPCYSSLF